MINGYIRYFKKAKNDSNVQEEQITYLAFDINQDPNNQ